MKHGLKVRSSDFSPAPLHCRPGPTRDAEHRVGGAELVDDRFGEPRMALRRAESQHAQLRTAGRELSCRLVVQPFGTDGGEEAERATLASNHRPSGCVETARVVEREVLQERAAACEGSDGGGREVE